MREVFASAVLAFVLFGVAGARAQSAPAIEREDAERLCPLVSKQLAAKAAEAVKTMSHCEVYCSGCGCKGGPGYRSKLTGRCVGWADIVSVCGQPPHARCTRECEPVVAGCAGRAWVKALAAKMGLAITFLPGTKRANASDRRNGSPDAKSNAPDTLLDQNAGATAPSQACGTKRTCREMSSCEEARHYLHDCGLSRLDGDGDGVPCNSLCRGR